MPNWETIDIACDADACLFSWDDLIERETRDDIFVCPVCDGPAHRTMSIPNVTRVSYQDGYSKGAAYEELKQIARLKKTRADMHHDKRGDINKEIAERRKTAHNAKDKSNGQKGEW